MSRPIQRVVGGSKERFRPTALESLAQGSKARADQIRAFREAELALREDPISNLTPAELTTRRLKPGIIAGGTASVALLVSIACGGGSEDTPENTPDTGPQTPVATKTAIPEPSPTQVVPTEAPTVAPSPETGGLFPPEFEIPKLEGKGGVLEAYKLAYAELDATVRAGLDNDGYQSYAKIEELLKQCNGEGVPADAYAPGLIDTCAEAGRRTLTIPGFNEIPEFGAANQLHGLFTVARAWELWPKVQEEAQKAGQSMTVEEFEDYMFTLINGEGQFPGAFPYFPKS